MARIRSIKPEFPQSESMGNVSRDARLLFVELWTICDDEGRTRGNSRMLASLLFPYDDDAPELIDGWIGELERESCIIRYKVNGSTYIQVCNWLNHQKIDKPSRSKIPSFDESSRILANPRLRIKDQGVDQGEDQGMDQGEEGITPSAPPSGVTADASIPATVVDLKSKTETELQSACREVWHAYSLAYFDRYGTEPVRNAKVNSMVKQFAQRIPRAEAPAVAAFFLLHGDAFYVRKAHDFGQLLTDAEKLRMEWATSRQITGTQARQSERVSAMWQAVEQIEAAERIGATA